jgi:transporter family-2 protein
VTLTTWIALPAIVLGGAVIATQAPLNAALARHTGDPIVTAIISFTVGFVPLFCLMLLRGRYPAAEALLAAPWYAWLGGFCGAYFVVAVILTAPVLGVLTMVTAVVLGQLVAATALDALGAFGLPQQPVTWKRLAAVALAAAALVLSRG